jgi:hypothetical protein
LSLVAAIDCVFVEAPSLLGDCHIVTNMGASTIAGDDRQFSKWIRGTGVTEQLREKPTDAEFRNELAEAKLLPVWFADVVSRLVLACTPP